MQVDNRLLSDGSIVWILHVLEIDCLFYREWKERYASR